MARSKPRAWAPVASGSLVLYGVKGYTTPDGQDKGCLVLLSSGNMQKLRNLYHGLDGIERLSKPKRIPDREAEGGHRTIYRVYDQDRGTYVTEPIEGTEDLLVILTVRNKEYLRFVLEPKYLREKAAPRSTAFALDDE
jgi:hypothetical protein